MVAGLEQVVIQQEIGVQSERDSVQYADSITYELSWCKDAVQTTEQGYQDNAFGQTN